MKTITVGQLRQNPTTMLAEVEAGQSYSVTRHGHEVARVLPVAFTVPFGPRKRVSGSNLARLARHELRTATSIDELLADERDR